jgi:DNA-binding HxlR family transcriptional regulator
MDRRYDDPCGIARALDVVGERWALLVVRELVHGPKRFGDLRRGLGGISPNVLSQRLDDLERHGVLGRTTLGPPVGATVYELTEHGRGLVPVLDALAGWGSRLPVRSGRGLSRDALLFALRSTVRVETAPPVRIVLDGTGFDAVVEGRALDLRAPAGPATATLSTSTAGLRGLAFGDLDLDAELAAGRATVDGSRAAVRGFLAAFARPAPIVERVG